MKNATFDVTGMSCGGCVRHVSDALRKVAGVEVRQVTIGSADVSFDPARASAAQIAGAIAAAGYAARERATSGHDADHGHTCRTGGGGCCEA